MEVLWVLTHFFVCCLVASHAFALKTEDATGINGHQ